jgi:hypothetical protein
MDLSHKKPLGDGKTSEGRKRKIKEVREMGLLHTI